MRMLILVAIIMTFVPFTADEAQTSRWTERPITGEYVATGLLSEWKNYQSEKWGYSFKYPANWRARITLKNVGRHEHVIRERVSCFSPDYVEITVDVWTNPSKLHFREWFERNRKWCVADDAQITSCIATALELPAICAREPRTQWAYEEFNCLFQKGDHIYRIKYTNSDAGKSMEVYRCILSTFDFN